MSRSTLLVLVCLAACGSAVKDLPADRSAGDGKALVAARVVHGGVDIGPRLFLRPEGGNRILIEPAHEAFLIELEPGRYTIERFGNYVPVLGRVTFEAAAGEARYIGDFRPFRDEKGNLRIVVGDELEALRKDLMLRYGGRTPALQRNLVRSSLDPLDEGERDVVIAMRPWNSRVSGTVTGSFGYGAGVSRPYYICWPYEDDPLDG